MNQVSTRSAGALAIASLGNLKAGLQNVTSTIVAAGGDPFLRIGSDGVWVYGAENVEVQDGSLWAANPLSLMHGFVAWTDRPGKQANEVVGEVMVPMTSPLPPQMELADVSGPDNAKWNQQLMMQLVCLSGEDKGQQVIYKTTSVGGMNAMKSLINSIMAQLEIDETTPVPALELLSDSYPHKKWGKTYVPILEVKKWLPMSNEAPEVASPETGKAEQAEAAKPSRKRAAAAEKPAAKPADNQATVAVSAADRKAALLAQLAEMDGQSDEGEQEEAVDENVAAETAADDAAPRRRRRA